jgi:hypothetical protein
MASFPQPTHEPFHAALGRYRYLDRSDVPHTFFMIVDQRCAHSQITLLTFKRLTDLLNIRLILTAHYQPFQRTFHSRGGSKPGRRLPSASSEGPHWSPFPFVAQLEHRVVIPDQGSYSSYSRLPLIATMQATEARYAHDSGRIGLPLLENTPGAYLCSGHHERDAIGLLCSSA